MKANTIQSVDRAFRLLEYLAEKGGCASLTELSKGLDLPGSTVHRFLASLMNLGYVDQDDESGKYTLGLKVLTLSSVLLATMDERKFALPIMQKLMTATGETVNLTVRDGIEVVYIEKVEPDSLVRVFSRIGKRAPVHATGVGKLFLCDLPQYEVIELFKDNALPKLTENTIGSIEELLTELELVRKRGYGLDREECEIGARCVAVPIRNHRGQVMYGLSVSGPTHRLPDERMPEILGMALDAAYALSVKLGYQGKYFEKDIILRNTR